MANQLAQQFKPGDIVRVRDDHTGEVSEPVTVRTVYSTSGGLRLEREVLGAVSWNERDCLPA